MAAPASTVPRCVLFFPGVVPVLYAKGAATAADLVCLDLEDAVAVERKGEARDNAVRLLTELGESGSRLIVRVNHPSTDEGRADLEALGRLPSDVPAPALVIPKVGGVDDVEAARAALDERAEVTRLVVMIETAAGVADVEAIARGPGVIGLLFGGLDLSIDIGARLGWEPLLYARSRLVIAARAAGVIAIDMPHLDLEDAEGLREETTRVWQLGFDAKAAIHPKQVPVIADAFAHTPEEVLRARQIVAIADGAEEGVFIVRGQMVDRPAIEAARRVVAWEEARGG